MPDPTLAVAILARDNESEIAACLESVSWADERLVLLDTRSTDRTAAIAAACGARVVTHPFVNFAQQREFGLSLPTTDWLFYLDSDERATPALGQELRQVILQEAVGWWVPRRNFIWGRETRHGGWHPDYQLRLLRLGHAHYDPTREVHEIVLLEGAEGYLREPLLHYNYHTLGQFANKQRQYVALEAGILYKSGVRPKPWTYLSQPLREFRRRYVQLRGYRDGVHGLLLCTLVAYYYGFRVTVELGRLWRQR
jgi:(heptosyl)LPS beta-1,4-glucosyltransferase